LVIPNASTQQCHVSEQHHSCNSANTVRNQ